MTLLTANTTTDTWQGVCQLQDLLPERGAAAIVDGVQVALFRLADGTVRAVQQRDPFSGANVISRGIVGSRAGRPTVTSPMYKQVFDLVDGTCLDDGGRSPVAGQAADLATWPVSVRDGAVGIALTPGPVRG
ncbi:nitrite reductase small subunit NirD [Tessaracoccus rhinocerotis]|uniref:Nitrite reductase small subunit NirD n=1 Tax=Tessaracoccus rhinocerotis TaxID=1689449 RepID=A0A553K1L2_9ACTN|nr:nitrite reductase small subunit NirD [Tessaracoccus rhinocerotis]TRY18579.1 nitrite reductase small subunit NirD [Tessaracoccus rhinocerotis]